MRRTNGCLSLFVVFFSAAVAAGAPRTERRVVILAIDGLRPDHLHTYLNAREYAGLRAQGFLATALASGRGRLSPEGVDRAVATFPSYTWPAWGAIFTGHYPGRHGIEGQTFFMRDRVGWERGRGQFFDTDRKFSDGPHVYGWELDDTGKAKLEALFRKIPGLLRPIARKLADALGNKIAGAIDDKTFTLARVLSGLKTAGKSAVTEFLRVPTLYDSVLAAGLRAHVVFQFYHPKSRNADDAETYSRPGKETIFRIGLGQEIGGKLGGGVLEKAVQALRSLLEKIGHSKLFEPLLEPLQRYLIGPLLATVLPDKYVNSIRGEAYHDQRAAQEALLRLKERGDLPHVFTIYQAAVDGCSHAIPGGPAELRDIQARCLGFVDRNLKPVIDAIAATPSYRETLFVLVSDHGHSRTLEPKAPALRIAEDASSAKCELAPGGKTCLQSMRAMLGAAGVGACQYVEARNGHMDHVYLLPNRRALAAFADDKSCPAPGANEPLAFPGERAAEVASAILRRPELIPRGVAGLFARTRGEYRVYFARRYRPGLPQEPLTFPNGAALEEFAQSEAGKKMGFIELATRLRGANDPLRSGDLILVSDPEAHISFVGSVATHGGLLTDDSFATLAFFGPAVDKVTQTTVPLRQAFPIDIAPTVLRYLGVDAGDRPGRPLFDEALKPIP
jgi:hypothetical protein